MVRDLLPGVFAQARVTPDADLLPVQFGRHAETYIIICEAEDKSPKTVDSYRRCLVQFGRYLKETGIDIDAVTSREVGVYLRSVKQRGCSADTVYSHHKILRAFFNWMKGDHLIQTSPMENIRQPRLPRRIIKPLSAEDINNVLILCSGNSFLDLRNRAIILVFLDTGLRLTELADIMVSDIDVRTGLFKVLGKGDKERIVRIGKITRHALLRYLLNHTGDEHLWLTEEMRPMSPVGVQEMVKRLLKRAGVSSSKHGPHILRHTAAINFLRNGGTITSLQMMLGHSKVTTTMVYLSSLGAEDMITDHKLASPVDRLGVR